MAVAKAGALLLVLLIWQLAPLPDYVLSPAAIARNFVEALGSAELYENIGASLQRSLPGFALGSLLGATLGLAATLLGDPAVLILDEIGYLPLDKAGADLLFQVISQRYERGSIIMTTNKAYKQWPAIFNNDAGITAAILDRLLHRAQTVVIEGSGSKTIGRTMTAASTRATAPTSRRRPRRFSASTSCASAIRSLRRP